MPLLRLVVYAAAFAAMLAPAEAACLKDTADVESAEGRLTVVAARDAAGRRERPYILALSSPACLTASDPEDSVEATRTIHVFPANPRIQAAMAALVGKAIVVRGRVFPAHTSHHHAPIVMEIAEVAVR